MDLTVLERLPPGFKLTPTGCLLTPADIVIGGAYQPPPPDAGASADAIQTLLLRGPMPVYRLDNSLRARAARFARRALRWILRSMP